MPRIPDSEIERLKTEVSLVRLVESSGVKLARKGKDELAGRCPFHDDDTPSLSVNAAKNLFRCFGCDVGGGPIDWVMKAEGVSFRHAVELLREGAVSDDRPASAAPPVPLHRAQTRCAGVVRCGGRRAAGPGHRLLPRDAEADARGAGLPAHSGPRSSRADRALPLGFADRTLGLRLPEKNRKAGAEIRGQLERIGLYRQSGHEHFTGSLVVPVMDAHEHSHRGLWPQDQEQPRKGTPLHLYLPGPHRGVWNVDGIAGSGGEVILAECLIDAMTFWCAGYRNVTATYGAGGLTDDHLAAFRELACSRVLIAFDRDEAGDKGAGEVAERLMAAGIACYRIAVPERHGRQRLCAEGHPCRAFARHPDPQGRMAWAKETPRRSPAPQRTGRGAGRQHGS